MLRCEGLRCLWGRQVGARLETWRRVQRPPGSCTVKKRSGSARNKAEVSLETVLSGKLASRDHAVHQNVRRNPGDNIVELTTRWNGGLIA